MVVTLIRKERCFLAENTFLSSLFSSTESNRQSAQSDSFTRNLARSLTLSTRDSFKDLYPNIAQVSKTAGDIVKPVVYGKQTAANVGASARKYKNNITQSLRKMKAQIKSGKFYDREANEKAMLSAAGMDDALDAMDELDSLDFDDEDDKDYSKSSVTEDKPQTEVFRDDDGSTTVNTVESKTVNSLKVIKNNSLLNPIVKTMSVTVENIIKTNQEGFSLVEETISKANDERLTFYNDVSDKLATIANSVNNLADLYGKKVQTSLANSSIFDDLLDGSSNFNDLRKSFSDRYNDYKKKHGIVSDNRGLQSLMKKIKNPILFPLEAAMKKADAMTGNKISTLNTISKQKSSRLSALFDMIGQDPTMASGKIEDVLNKIGIKNNLSSNSFLNDMLGKLGGLTGGLTYRGNGNITANRAKASDKALFDQETHTTINKVLPGYLAKIYAGLTGTEEMYFDYPTGSWRKASDIRKSVESRKLSSMKSSNNIASSIADLAKSTESGKNSSNPLVRKISRGIDGFFNKVGNIFNKVTRNSDIAGTNSAKVMEKAAKQLTSIASKEGVSLDVPTTISDMLANMAYAYGSVEGLLTAYKDGSAREAMVTKILASKNISDPSSAEGRFVNRVFDFLLSYAKRDSKTINAAFYEMRYGLSKEMRDGNKLGLNGSSLNALDPTATASENPHDTNIFQSIISKMDKYDIIIDLLHRIAIKLGGTGEGHRYRPEEYSGYTAKEHNLRQRQANIKDLVDDFYELNRKLHHDLPDFVGRYDEHPEAMREFIKFVMAIKDPKLRDAFVEMARDQGFISDDAYKQYKAGMWSRSGKIGGRSTEDHEIKAIMDANKADHSARDSFGSQSPSSMLGQDPNGQGQDSMSSLLNKLDSPTANKYLRKLGNTKWGRKFKNSKLGRKILGSKFGQALKKGKLGESIKSGKLFKGLGGKSLKFLKRAGKSKLGKAAMLGAGGALAAKGLSKLFGGHSAKADSVGGGNAMLKSMYPESNQGANSNENKLSGLTNHGETFGSTSNDGNHILAHSAKDEGAGDDHGKSKQESEAEKIDKVMNKYHQGVKDAGISDATMKDPKKMGEIQFAMTPMNQAIDMRGNNSQSNKIFQFMHNVIANMSGGSASAGAGSGSGTTSAGGGSNEEKVWNTLKANGFTDEAAAGVMGNAQQESNFDPKASNGTHTGIFQWDNANRYASLQSWAKSQGKDFNDAGVQAEFAIKEAQEGGYLDEIKSLTNVQSATAAWESKFERSGGSALGQRQQYAQAAYDKYHGKGGGSSSSDSSSSSQPAITQSSVTAMVDNALTGGGDHGTPSSDSSSSGGGSGQIAKAIDWGREQMGKVTYSMEARTGPSSYDCSSFVYFALKNAGFNMPVSYPWSTVTEDDYANKGEFFDKISSGDVGFGDVFVVGTSGAAAHTGFFTDQNKTILHCNYDHNGVTEDKGPAYFEAMAKMHAGEPRFYRVKGGGGGGGNGGDGGGSDPDDLEGVTDAFIRMTKATRDNIQKNIEKKYLARFTKEAKKNQEFFQALDKSEEAFEGEDAGIIDDGTLAGGAKVIGTDAAGNLIIAKNDGTFGTIKSKADLRNYLGLDGKDGKDGVLGDPSTQIPLDRIGLIKQILERETDIETVLKGIFKQVVKITSKDNPRIDLYRQILAAIKNTNKLHGSEIDLLNLIYQHMPDSIETGVI